MTDKSKYIIKWESIIKSRKLTYILVALGFLSIVLIICAPTSKSNEVALTQEVCETETYEDYLIEQISVMVAAITNEQTPHVTVTLRTNGETVYATENRTSERNSQEYSDSTLNKTLSDGDTEKTYIIVKNADGSQQPLIVTQIKPEIQGVVIVSKYGNNATVREKITQAVKTALNLSSTQVCVVGQAEYT